MLVPEPQVYDVSFTCSQRGGHLTCNPRDAQRQEKHNDSGPRSMQSVMSLCIAQAAHRAAWPICLQTSA